MVDLLEKIASSIYVSIGYKGGGRGVYPK